MYKVTEYAYLVGISDILVKFTHSDNSLHSKHCTLCHS